MYQRPWLCQRARANTGKAEQTGQAHSKPWVLVEEAGPLAQVSDFSRFREAGFEVALCSGPKGAGACPLACEGHCQLADAADVVLFGLALDDAAAQDVLRAHLRHHPGTPVVVEAPRSSETDIPADNPNCTVLPFPTSVNGQIRALWNALLAGGQRR